MEAVKVDLQTQYKYNEAHFLLNKYQHCQICHVLIIQYMILRPSVDQIICFLWPQT